MRESAGAILDLHDPMHTASPGVSSTASRARLTSTSDPPNSERAPESRIPLHRGAALRLEPRFAQTGAWRQREL